mmetsp:Transcript_63391/g.138029  ORF Transcript_63391/g.138029 Transcript_63391/m.138029 type:complete len:206 (+) Transcript_63391:732-1349(+)
MKSHSLCETGAGFPQGRYGANRRRARDRDEATPLERAPVLDKKPREDGDSQQFALPNHDDHGSGRRVAGCSLKEVPCAVDKSQGPERHQGLQVQQTLQCRVALSCSPCKQGHEGAADTGHELGGEREGELEEGHDPQPLIRRLAAIRRSGAADAIRILGAHGEQGTLRELGGQRLKQTHGNVKGRRQVWSPTSRETLLLQLVALP